MKRTLITALLAIMFVSSCILAQNVDANGPRLHARLQPPNEQLLPPSVVPTVDSPDRKKYPQKYSAIYMPISLAPGRVRTPVFPVEKVSQWYDIMVQVEKRLPFFRMVCMVGVIGGPLDAQHCEKDDPILRANWTVWEDQEIVHWGSIPNDCGCVFAEKNVFKVIGSFPLEAGKKYVVQVHFTKDGSPLNVANPHLIVIPHKKMF